MVLASITDFLDGYYARKLNLTTNFGKLADPVADKLLVLTVLITLCHQQLFPLWAVLVIIARELLVDGLRLILTEKGIVLAAGILGKIKTNCQLLCIILVLFACPLWSTEIMMYLAVFFTILSGADYLWKARTIFTE